MKMLNLFLLSTIFLFFQNLYAFDHYKIKFVRYKLENGLTVILHKDTSKPIVSIGVIYHVGSKNEDPNRTGFAHFFEHLMFDGSKNIKRGEFDSLILNAGGEANAYTTFDYTYYEMSLPSNQLPLALWMESERLLNLKITREGLETQRKVVKEERRERLDNQPYGNLSEILFSTSFQKHPYRWLPIGSNQYIDSATLEEFQDFYKKFYTPENTVLVIAGDFKIRSVKNLINTYFGRIPKSQIKITKEKTIEPPLQKDRVKTVYYNVEFPVFSYSFFAPAFGTNDYYAFLFLNSILSTGESSRFNQKLKIKENLVLDVETSFQAMEDYGLYFITCYAKNEDNYKKIETHLKEEIIKLQTTFVTDRELEKVKNRIQRMILDSNSNLSGIAENLALSEMFYGNAGYINSEFDKISSVTKEDLQRVAKTYLTLDKKIILNYLTPQKK